MLGALADLQLRPLRDPTRHSRTRAETRPSRLRMPTPPSAPGLPPACPRTRSPLVFLRELNRELPGAALTSSYGYLSGSWANSLVQRRSHFPQPPHKRAAAARLQARDDVTVNNGNGGTTDGQVMFYSLLQQGALASDGQGGYTGAGGFVRHWDSCSSTVSERLLIRGSADPSPG